MRAILREYGIAIAATAGLAVLFRFLVLEAYSIPGSSMGPNLLPGDQVLVWKTPYIFSTPTPKRGTVVLVSPPEDPGHRYLRRVIGLPGDQVELREGMLFVNGSRAGRADVGGTSSADCAREMLDGIGYLSCVRLPALPEMPRTQVPKEMVFLMADLRTQLSGDFPAASLVPLSSILGKAQWIWISIRPGPESQQGFFSRLRFERLFRRVSS